MRLSKTKRRSGLFTLTRKKGDGHCCRCWCHRSACAVNKSDFHSYLQNNDCHKVCQCHSFSRQSGAKKSILEAVRIVSEAAYEAGCPRGAIGAVTIPTMEATQELMRHKDTSLILATGVAAMVRAAYSSGTPAIGVDAGNGPAYIDASADVRRAVKRIVDSKSFDYGTICTSEQSIVVTEAMKETVLRELKGCGAYIFE